MKRLCFIFYLLVLFAGICSAHSWNGIEKGNLIISGDQLLAGEIQNDSIEPFLVETQSSLRLFSDMDNYSSVVLYIPKNEVVEVFEEVGKYYVALYEGNKGYILTAKVSPLNFSLQAEEDNKTQVNSSRGKKNSQARLNYLNSKYDNKTAQAIYSHRLWIGMSTTMARESWGNPIKMDRYMAAEPKFEEWTYSKYMLFFEGGKLAGWEWR